MPNRIEAEGPRNARIALFGESPWKTENALGRPFVGASGNLQKRWWGEIGLSREEIYIDNMYPYMPPFPAPLVRRPWHPLQSSRPPAPPEHHSDHYWPHWPSKK